MLKIFFSLLFAIMLTIPAFAGTMNFSDGGGSWQSTRCSPPNPPSSLPKDPETPANDLNAKMGARGQYISALENYMACVSKEAEGDATAAGQIIIRAAQDLIRKAHAEIEKFSSQK